VLSAATAGASVSFVASTISQYCAELDALLASRGRSSGSSDFDHQRELEFLAQIPGLIRRHQVHALQALLTLLIRSPLTKKTNQQCAQLLRPAACN
jgi:hypothetical protein